MSPWRKTVYAAWVGQVFSILGFSCVLPFLPFYVQHLGVTGESEVRIWSGLIGAASGVTLVLFSPIWGVLADRFGRKPMVLRSMFGGAAILVVMGFCQSVEQLLICRFIQGMLTGTVTASITLVASVVPRERTGFALGLMGSAVYVGATVGPLVGGAVAAYVSYRAAFLTAAFLLLMGGVLVKVVVREDFSPVRSADAEARGHFGQVFASSGFLAAVFAYFAIRFAYSVATPVYPLFVDLLYSGARQVETVAGLVISTGGLAAACSAAVFGRFGDAWGHKRMLVASSLFTGLAAALHAVAQSVTHLFVLRVLFGLGVGVMIPAINAIIRNVTHDKNLGRAYGATTSLTFIGFILGPLAGGYLSASLGLRAPFALMGAAFLSAAALVTWRVQADPTSRS